LEADVQKQQCLKEKRQEKAFEQAMIESPMGGFMKHKRLQSLESLLFRCNKLAQRIRYWWRIWCIGGGSSQARVFYCRTRR